MNVFKITTAEQIISAEEIAEVSKSELRMTDLDAVVGGAGWTPGMTPPSGQRSAPGDAKLGSQPTGLPRNGGWSGVPSSVHWG